MFPISSGKQVPQDDPLFQRFNALQVKGTPVEKCIDRCTKEFVGIPEDNLPPKHLYLKDPNDDPIEIERKRKKHKPDHAEQEVYFQLLRAIKSDNFPCLIISGYEIVSYLKREKEEAKQVHQKKVGNFIRINSLNKLIVAQN